jgi:hypothetical protein
MGIQWKDGFSAHVELFLLVEDKKLRVAQVGPESLILRDTCTIPPGTRGRIVIKVDDRRKSMTWSRTTELLRGPKESNSSNWPRDA